MKNIEKFFILSVFCFLLSAFMERNDNPSGINHSDKKSTSNYVMNLSSSQMNANNINTWFRNNGSFNRNPSTDNSGFEWPKNSTKFARYASGLWISAKVGVDTLVCVAEYSYEYRGGNIPDIGGPPQGETDPNFKIYNISNTDTSEYPAWRNFAIPQGAYSDSVGNPYRMGAQTQFYSYTDGYPAAHGNRAGSTAPLGAVILQTNWCYLNGSIKNVIFTEYKIINRSTQTWENAYISVWTDDDLGTATDDAVGIDTNLELGYTYNYTGNDGIYGNVPPAVGFLLLRKPVVPSIGNTVSFYNPPGSNNLITLNNYKEIELSSFSCYTNGVAGQSDPTNYHETYNVMQGQRANGTYWINPNTNQQTLFPYSGKPESGTGWNMNSGDDRRFMMNFGPLIMLPNDTQSVIVAQVISGLSGHLQNIADLRTLANTVRGIYNSNFQSVISVNNVSDQVPAGFELKQNYPNPFNPVTKINYELPVSNHVSLIVYDILGNEIKSLVNEKQNAGTYQVEFDGSGFTSGVYYYKFTTDEFVETKKMMLVK